jgi:hypothetical protein
LHKLYALEGNGCALDALATEAIHKPKHDSVYHSSLIS